MPSPLRSGTPAGQALFAIEFGNTNRQAVEIGGVTLVNYGSRLRPDQLPFKKITYEGREPDAPWRRAARERIEKHRKGDLRIVVTDGRGRPVSGAQVKVTMTRHAYKFGSGAWEGFYNPDVPSPDAPKFRESARHLFNHIIIGRGFLWDFWNDPKVRPLTFKSVDWLRANGFTIHGGGHLVWPGWRHLPRSLKAEYDRRVAGDGAEPAREWLRRRVRDHVREIVSTARGRVDAWNVVNETRGNRDLLDILGREEMVEWFRIARQADPAARLFINENSVERPGPQADLYEQEIRFLQGKGAPLDAVGLQGHVGANSSIPQMEKALDQFARLGLPLEITEFDTVTPDEELQAAFTRDYLTLVFSHPATHAFVMWGFWDAQHWLNDAPIYYRDWSLKPCGKAYLDLVRGQWWTNATLRSDRRGRAAVRGFLGDYQITVSAPNGSVKTVPVRLAKPGATVELRLN